MDVKKKKKRVLENNSPFPRKQEKGTSSSRHFSGVLGTVLFCVRTGHQKPKVLGCFVVGPK